jgi:hypothetical protein
LAAAPVRVGEDRGILTVPLALREIEIEREIDTLDRRVLLASLLFCAAGCRDRRTTWRSASAIR